MRSLEVKSASILLPLFTKSFTSSVAFSIIQNRPQTRNYCPSSSFKTKLFSSTLSLERTAQREIAQFQEWASAYGAQTENGFYIQGQLIDDNEDYYATTSGAGQGSRMLYIPGGMILSSSWIAQEYEGIIDESLQILYDKERGDLYHQFLLFVKVIMEYQQGDASPYAPWFQSMPRKWNTAVSMDDFCLSCLPPYLLSLCQKERNQLKVFREALSAFDYITPESKNNSELMKFAYNVVFTRAIPSYEYGDYKIIPMVDFINHGYPDNVEISYDEEGGCELYLKEDVGPNEPLTLSYPTPYNPSQLLATYGFLNESPAFFSKILFTNPSNELINIGYDPERMIYYTQDGSISQEVWDAFLYSRLEKKAEYEHYKNQFYQACMTGDEETKAAIHEQFYSDTVKALLRHVNHILIEVHDLTVKMYAFDASKHPRLPLLRRHHDMVTDTFTKVHNYLMAIQ